MSEPKLGWIQCWQDNLRIFWNPAKARQEIWIRSPVGGQEWVLREVRPGRNWEESFMGDLQFVAAVLGVLLDRSWSSNGQPAPTAGNFIPCNEVGGGLDLTCLGAAVDDWVAIHTGGNYPVTVAKSPHLHMMGEIADSAGVFILVGLVGAVGLNVTAPGAAGAWTVPDDGIWVVYDTDVDNNLRFVTRSSGVQTPTIIAAAAPVGHARMNMVVSDDGTEVSLMLQGTTMVTHTTNLPTVQLKPYMMVMSRAGGAVVKNVHLHDFRLQFDRGF